MDITPDVAYAVEICVDGDCVRGDITVDLHHPGSVHLHEGELGPSPETLARWMLLSAETDSIEYYLLSEEDYGESITVDFSLRDPAGSVLAQTQESTEVPLVRAQPNGRECPPICYGGLMIL